MSDGISEARRAARDAQGAVQNEGVVPVDGGYAVVGPGISSLLQERALQNYKREVEQAEKYGRDPKDIKLHYIPSNDEALAEVKPDLEEATEWVRKRTLHHINSLLYTGAEAERKAKQEYNNEVLKFWTLDEEPKLIPLDEAVNASVERVYGLMNRPVPSPKPIGDHVSDALKYGLKLPKPIAKPVDGVKTLPEILTQLGATVHVTNTALETIYQTLTGKSWADTDHSVGDGSIMSMSADICSDAENMQTLVFAIANLLKK